MAEATPMRRVVGVEASQHQVAPVQWPVVGVLAGSVALGCVVVLPCCVALADGVVA
jgi:hypothetical protein